MRQLVHSLSGNKLLPLHLWWREIVLKSENVDKCSVQDCLKNFLLTFTSLKMHWNSKNDQFLAEKCKKPLRKYCSAAIWTTFSPKFVLDTQVQNSAPWNISYLGLWRNRVLLNINLTSECVCWNSKIFRKCKIKWSGLS